MTDLEQLAREAELLRMLRDHVDEEIDARKLRIRTAGPGWKHRAELPNPADPSKPLAAASVRVDNGDVTARVTNPATFLSWVRREFPSEIVTRDASSNRANISARLREAARAVGKSLFDQGPFEDELTIMLGTLEERGFTVAELVTTTPDPEVHPTFQAKLLAECKINKAANYQGVEVDGVTVTVGDPSVVISPSKDRALVRRYVQLAIGNGTAQALLAGGAPDG